MQKKYFKIFVGIIIMLWMIYFIQMFLQYREKRETFTPRIHALYRPYFRSINSVYSDFSNKYGPNTLLYKLRKWNIY